MAEPDSSLFMLTSCVSLATTLPFSPMVSVLSPTQGDAELENL